MFISRSLSQYSLIVFFNFKKRLGLAIFLKLSWERTMTVAGFVRWMHLVSSTATKTISANTPEGYFTNMVVHEIQDLAICTNFHQ